MAESFNTMQHEIARSSVALDLARQRMLDANEQRAQLEREARQAQKMDAVGQLAGGVAHDFNNLLTVIVGYADIALMRNPDSSAAEIGEIRRAADRAAELTQQLLTFSRRQIVQPRVVDLNEAVAETARMLERLLGDHVTLALELHTEPVLAEIDPGQLEQVIVNLAVNARDAMASGGELVVTTSVTDSNAVIEVRDQGAGMDENTRLRVFEPFFTTKEVGQGTGLGLSTAYGIVHQAKGVIELESSIGHGTLVRIVLPRSERELPTGQPEAPSVPRPLGGERILLVEDEDAVRDLVATSLESCGYDVISAATPARALQAADKHEFDLLLTDVMMPHMNGQELANRLRASRPRLNVLYMSGHASHVLHEDGELDEATNFLQKPFALDTLARKVRDALDSRPPALLDAA
jgi:nitrogen-specific signal transduction histidine kinase